jgi:hypothetical protein
MIPKQEGKRKSFEHLKSAAAVQNLPRPSESRSGRKAQSKSVDMENQLSFLKGYSYFNDRNRKESSHDSSEERPGHKPIGEIKAMNVHSRKMSVKQTIRFESFHQNKLSLKNNQTVMSSESEQSE